MKLNNNGYEGKVLLQGFDAAEIKNIKKIINKYDKKLARLGYKEIRLTLQRHQKGGKKGRAYLNEIKGLIKLENRLIHAEATGYEFYPAVTEVMKKLEKEAEHLIRLENKHKGK